MATDHLQIPDISASQNQKEVTANAAHNLLDRAQNQLVQKTVAGGLNTLTTTETRENGIVEAIGTPGSPFFLDMPDTNERMLTIFNNADDVCTVRNSASAGSGQPVIQVGEAAIFHYDGTDFIDITDAAIAASSWIGLTDTPSSFSAQAGRLPRVNAGETALEFVQQAAANNVIAATTGDSDFATTFEDGDAIDGVTLATGDRILIKDQSAGEENGVYIVQASGAPVRVPEFIIAADIQENPFIVAILEGTVNAETVWVHTTAGAITVDTTALTFAQFGSVATFLGLSDTPGSMAGESGTRLVPNNAENALVFEGTPHKDPVVVATTVTGVLADVYENGDTIDGIVLVTGDRILIKDQSAGAENGIYIVEASGAPTRADDFDDDKDAVLGCTVAVNEGSVNGQTFFQMTNITAVTIGSTAQTWASIGGGSSNRWVEATLQTTDATVTSIADIPVASGEAIVVRGFIIGTLSGSPNSLAASFTGAAKNDGGTTALLAAASITTIDGDGGNSWAVTIDADDTGDDLRIRVAGQGSTTIDWRVQYEIITEDNT